MMKTYRCHDHCTLIQLMFLIFSIIATSVPADQITVTLQNGVEIGGVVYVGAEDASIGTRTSHSGTLSLERGYKYQRGLLRFDLTPIPSCPILSATLSLYIESYPGLLDSLKYQGNIQLGIYKVNKADWDDNAASWDTYDGINTWATPGGDFDPVPVTTFTIDTADGFQDLWVSFDVTSLIQQYVDQGTEPNSGVLLKAQNQLYPILYLVHSESDSITYRPKLEITHVVEAPLANAGEDQGVRLGEAVTLDATKSFVPNGSAKELIYQWHFTSKPGASSLTDSDIVPNNTTGTMGADTPSFTPDVEGDYEIELITTSSLGFSDKDWVIVSSLDINPHPRIWLTPEILQTLKDRAAANTPEWVKFMQIVNSYFEGKAHIYNQALAYLVTGDEIYAARALDIMNDVYNFDPTSTPGYAACYWARYAAAYLAVGYDWLYGYLNDGDKTRFIEKMNEWAENYFYAPGLTWDWMRNGPHNNFFYGRIIGGGLTGIATFGDNSRAKEWLDIVRYDKYENLAKPEFTTHYKNGGWLYEGLGYGQASYEFLFSYFWALKTATGEDLFEDTGFPEAVVYSVIHNTQPPLVTLLPTGDTNNEPGGTTVNISDYTRTVMFLIAEGLRGSQASEYAQWYVNHNNRSTNMIRRENVWKDLLWYDPNAPERSIAELPLNYFDCPEPDATGPEGTGFIYSRSEWSEDATWVAFQSGGDEPWHDHQHLDQNSFYIFKEAWLASPGGIYSARNTINYNTIMVNDGSEDKSQHTRRNAPGAIERYEGTENYVYALGQAAGTYNSDHYNIHLLENYERQFVYIKPDCVVVFDRIRTADPAYYPKWLLHSDNEPIRDNSSSDLSTIISGNGKMFVKTLLPSNFTVSSIEGARWRIELVPTNIQTSFFFLNVLYATEVSTPSMPETTRVSGTTMIGTQTGDHVVMFSREETQLDNGQFSIIGSGMYRTIIADLIANTNYDVSIDGVLLGTYTTTDNGLLVFDLPLTGSHSIIINSGPPDNIEPAAITDLGASTGTQPGLVDLMWSATGDDGNIGTATLYIIRYSTSAITTANWDSAADVDGEPSPQPAGSGETFTATGLTAGQTYYFAIRARDEAENVSDISNSPSAMAGIETLGKPGKPIHVDS